MKRTILLLFVAAFGSACGSQPTAENRTAAVANKNASSNSMNSVSNLDKSAGPQPSGEKITAPITVKFGPQGFPAGWQWIDPDSKMSPTPYETKNGVLKFDIITTKDLYGENRTAPRLLKAVDGDFQIETRLKFDPTQDYQGAGC